MSELKLQIEALGGLHYDVDGGFVVELPDPRLPHSYISVHGYQIGSDWYLTDGRITKMTTGESFEAVTEHAKCAGLRVQIDEDGTISATPPHGLPLHEAVQRFVADVAAIPVVARALRCAAESARPREESAADQMAKRTRDHLVQRFPSLDSRGAIRLKPPAPKGSATVHVRPRLAVYRSGGAAAPPEVVCEFMDLRSSSPTRAFGPVASTFVAYHYVGHRFVIAAGDAAQLDELAELVEPVHAVVVSPDDYEPLDEAVTTLV